MTLKFAIGIELFTVVVLLLNCLQINGLGDDWLARTSQRRSRIQADIDLLNKYYCSRSIEDEICHQRLPKLKAELQQIDENLAKFRREGRRNYILDPQQNSYPNLKVSDLIQRRSFGEAEREILNRLNEVDKIVVETYDSQAVNFNLLVDFATAIRNSKLKFMIYKETLEEIIRHGHDEPLKVIRLIRGVYDEVLLGNTIDEETQTKATNMVENLKILFETGVSKAWIDSNIKNTFEGDMSVPQLADEISTFDPELFTKIVSKVVIAVYPLVDTEQLMRNMERFHLLPQLIDGYNAIYIEMEKFNAINGNRYILKLGYYLKELAERSNSTIMLISPEKKSLLQSLEMRLPGSIRSLIFSDKVCLKNKYDQQYIHIAHGHPRLLRYAVMAAGTQLKWIPKHMNYTAYFEFPYGGYLIVDDEQFDSRHRLVTASSNSDEMTESSGWEIIPEGDDCFIKTAAYNNDLLYVSEENDQNNPLYKVFTTTRHIYSVINDDRFKWTIQQC